MSATIPILEGIRVLAGLEGMAGCSSLIIFHFDWKTLMDEIMFFHIDIVLLNALIVVGTSNYDPKELAGKMIHLDFLP